MALGNLLQIAGQGSRRKEEINKDDVREHLNDYQRIIAYWRKYPDKFVDYLCSLNPDNTFKFYYIQRVKL